MKINSQNVNNFNYNSDCTSSCYEIESKTTTSFIFDIIVIEVVYYYSWLLMLSFSSFQWKWNSRKGVAASQPINQPTSYKWSKAKRWWLTYGFYAIFNTGTWYSGGCKWYFCTGVNAISIILTRPICLWFGGFDILSARLFTLFTTNVSYSISSMYYLTQSL